MSCRGTLVAVEGTDGSGKTTLVRSLVALLSRRGEHVATFDFPDYDEPLAGATLARFLRGEFGQVGDVDPVRLALLFALNRSQRAHEIREAIDHGWTVVCDRYVYSNVAFQGAKLADHRAVPEFARWVEDLEFNWLACPRPDLCLWLRAAPGSEPGLDHSTRGSRPYLAGATDIHEADLALQARVYGVYEKLCEERSWFWPLDSRVGTRLREPSELASEALAVLTRVRDDG